MSLPKRLFGAGLIGILAGVPTNALADEPSSGETAPSLRFDVTPTAVGPWLMRITNTGETPVRLAADARLISLEVGKEHCVLPDDARPSTDEGKELVVPATRSWSTSFDPLFYCFHPTQRAALSAGASVKVHFGWRPPAAKSKAAPSPPFAVSPVGASVGKVKPQKEIVSDPITLKDAVIAEAKPAAPPSDKSKDDDTNMPPKASLSLPATMDAAKGDELSTTVTFHNESDRPVTLMFRPDMVQFSLHGPQGSVSCGSPKSIASPIRELFVTVGAKSHTALGVLFTSTCAPGSFDDPGLYRIDARLDTRQASGRMINVRSWDSVATTTEPLLLRVRERRKGNGPGRRPQLD